MQTNVELNQDEVKTAIQLYLEEERGIEADVENISFNIHRSGGQPGEIGSPQVQSVTCKDVEY